MQSKAKTDAFKTRRPGERMAEEDRTAVTDSSL